MELIWISFILIIVSMFCLYKSCKYGKEAERLLVELDKKMKQLEAMNTSK